MGGFQKLTQIAAINGETCVDRWWRNRGVRPRQHAFLQAATRSKSLRPTKTIRRLRNETLHDGYRAYGVMVLSRRRSGSCYHGCGTASEENPCQSILKTPRNRHMHAPITFHNAASNAVQAGSTTSRACCAASMHMPTKTKPRNERGQRRTSATHLRGKTSESPSLTASHTPVSSEDSTLPPTMASFPKECGFVRRSVASKCRNFWTLAANAGDTSP